ncbi:hypothetical protein ACJJTC_010875 [Scirpophaga incertulas]
MLLRLAPKSSRSILLQFCKSLWANNLFEKNITESPEEDINSTTTTPAPTTTTRRSTTKPPPPQKWIVPLTFVVGPIVDEDLDNITKTWKNVTESMHNGTWYDVVNDTKPARTSRWKEKVVHLMWMNDTEMVIPDLGKHKWVRYNVGARGLYRVAPQDGNADDAEAALYSGGGPAERALQLDDAFVLSRARRLPARRALAAAGKSQAEAALYSGGGPGSAPCSSTTPSCSAARAACLPGAPWPRPVSHRPRRRCTRAAGRGARPAARRRLRAQPRAPPACQARLGRGRRARRLPARRALAAAGKSQAEAALYSGGGPGSAPCSSTTPSCSAARAACLPGAPWPRPVSHRPRRRCTRAAGRGARPAARRRLRAQPRAPPACQARLGRGRRARRLPARRALAAAGKSQAEAALYSGGGPGERALQLDDAFVLSRARRLPARRALAAAGKSQAEAALYSGGGPAERALQLDDAFVLSRARRLPARRALAAAGKSQAEAALYSGGGPGSAPCSSTTPSCSAARAACLPGAPWPRPVSHRPRRRCTRAAGRPSAPCSSTTPSCSAARAACLPGAPWPRPLDDAFVLSRARRLPARRALAAAGKSQAEAALYSGGGPAERALQLDDAFVLSRARRLPARRALAAAGKSQAEAALYSGGGPGSAPCSSTTPSCSAARAACLPGAPWPRPVSHRPRRRCTRAAGRGARPAARRRLRAQPRAPPACQARLGRGR